MIDFTQFNTLISLLTVEKGSLVITDELNDYNGLNDLGYSHSIVNHGAQQYADGDISPIRLKAFGVISVE